MNESLRFLIDNLEEVVQQFRDSAYDDDQYKQWQYQSIYRVPNRFRDLDESEFTPQVVSLGPYHLGESHLKEMESQKIRALNNLLERSEMDLEWWLDTLEKQTDVDKLKNHYDGLDPIWWDDDDDPRRFMKLMLLDGCFMLDILRTYNPAESMGSGSGYCETDPIFGGQDGMFYMDQVFMKKKMFYMNQVIRKDMLLLENQLPLLLLEMIIFIDGHFSKKEAFESSSSFKKSKAYIRRMIKDVFKLKGPVHKYRKCLHVLDMYRKSLIKDNDDQVDELQSFNQLNWLINMEEAGRLADKVICTIEMLRNIGIRFKVSETRSLDDLSFQNGVISLPFVELDVTTKSMFLNLIAFEKLNDRAGQEVTSYISFMSLVTSTTDVQILSTAGIIRNTLGSDHKAAELFNYLSRNATVLEMDDNTRKILRAIDKCYKDGMKKRRRLVSSFLQTYFKNLWTSTISVSATVLLGLTILQTVFAVISFYSQKNQPHKAHPP